MKKLFAGIILSLATVMALASPRPSDIENALAAHDMQSAKAMTQEALRDHPESPKAHLFNAYVLAKEGNAVAASEELKNVNRLDRSNDPGRSVRNSALYGRTVAELDRPQVNVVTTRKGYVAPPQFQYTQQEQVQHTSALLTIIKWMFYLTIIGLIILAIKKCIEARKPQRPVTTTWEGIPKVQRVEVEDRQYENNGRLYDAPPHALHYMPPTLVPAYQRPAPVYPAAPSTVVVNNGGSNSNGLVEGMMLNEMMHSHRQSRDDYGSPRIVERETYVEREVAAPSRSYSSPAPVDYESSRSSYSSGSSSDDDWKSSSSSSSSYSNDSWSSSSSDSSSSYDSGSSSSGSDW